MEKSVFNIEFQQKDVSSKIIVGLERISEAFRALLWEHTKIIGLSPIQIQILIFIAYHKKALCNVSHLAKEFNLTKPTISDAIKTLAKKGLIFKSKSSADKRSYSISLSEKGKKVVSQTERFAEPIKSELNEIEGEHLEKLYNSLNKVIYRLNQVGVLTVQRTCYGCSFYEKRKTTHFCNFLNTPLKNKDIRLDCPEFEKK